MRLRINKTELKQKKIQAGFNMLKDLIEKICSDCNDKEAVINRLVSLKLVDLQGLKYFLIHQYYMKMLAANYSIMDAVTLTADEFNISDRQVYRVRKWWKSRQEFKVKA